MKKLIIKFLALLILINISSCNTRRLNRQKSESSALQQSEIRFQDLKNERYEGKRMIILSDSANELYTVRIIPADTFSFSAQHGFRGKAAKIEVSGLLRRVMTRSDNTEVSAEKQTGRTYKEQYRSEKSELFRTGVLEKKSWRVVLVFILLGLLILLVWLLRRWIMQRFW